MNKALRIVLAVALIALVGVLVVGLLTKGTFGFISDEEYTLVEKTYSADDFTGIKLDTENRSITILPSTSGQIEVKYYDSDKNYFEVDDVGDVLKLVNDPVWYYNFISGFNIDQMTVYNHVDLYLPATTHYEVDVDTVNGRLEISDLEEIDKLTLETSNGALYVENVTCSGLIDIDSVNGGIHLTTVTASDDVMLDTENGGISLEDVTIVGTIDLTTTNGNFSLTNVQADQINATTTNGYVMGDAVQTEQFFAQTTNGQIDIAIVGSFDDYHVQMMTTNGQYYLDGDLVQINIYHTDKTPSVELESLNGSIHLSFSE